MPLVRLLLENHANPHAQTVAGETAASLVTERLQAGDERAAAFEVIRQMLGGA